MLSIASKLLFQQFDLLSTPNASKCFNKAVPHRYSGAFDPGENLLETIADLSTLQAYPEDILVSSRHLYDGGQIEFLLRLRGGI
jgi:hypothetical protein